MYSDTSERTLVLLQELALLKETYRRLLPVVEEQSSRNSGI